ncbi:hypothetical protein CRE_07762 [Caenorhabditis remanei]|uniref:Uncharacterized protein n=1 Tax=Caenorhabditis remanei TaxID=31234 RepID=E3N6Q7_CAERE|nr:hypothetical protein CRE_07762 [Caenorhabditis remanei]
MQTYSYKPPDADSDVDWDLHIMSDGLPRYYMKKPRGGPQEYARPLPADEMLDMIRAQKEQEWKKTWRYWREVVCRVILRLLDLSTTWFLYRMSCCFIRLTVGIFCVFTCKRFIRSVIRAEKKGCKFPMTVYLLNLIYHLFIPTTALRIFFWFDDRIEGPMFSSPEVQKYYLWLKFVSTQLMDVPTILLAIILKPFGSYGTTISEIFNLKVLPK